MPDPHSLNDCDTEAIRRCTLCQIAELKSALTELFELVESGYLVRNTARDGEEGWAMKQLPAVMTLKRAAGLIGKMP